MRVVAERKVHESQQHVPMHVEKAAHSAPIELRTTRRIFRGLQDSNGTGAGSPVKTLGCAAMMKCALVEAPSGPFAHAASAAVNQDKRREHGNNVHGPILSTIRIAHQLVESEVIMHGQLGNADLL